MTNPRKRGSRPKRVYTGPRPGYDDKRYRAMRELLKRTGANICHICGHIIDTQLKYPHPLSWSCDHVVPRSALSPDDPRQWSLSNAREAHYRCNSARGDKPLTPPQTNNQTSIDW